MDLLLHKIFVHGRDSFSELLDLRQEHFLVLRAPLVSHMFFS